MDSRARLLCKSFISQTRTSSGRSLTGRRLISSLGCAKASKQFTAMWRISGLSNTSSIRSASAVEFGKFHCERTCSPLSDGRETREQTVSYLGWGVSCRTSGHPFGSSAALSHWLQTGYECIKTQDVRRQQSGGNRRTVGTRDSTIYRASSR